MAVSLRRTPRSREQYIASRENATVKGCGPESAALPVTTPSSNCKKIYKIRYYTYVAKNPERREIMTSSRHKKMVGEIIRTGAPICFQIGSEQCRGSTLTTIIASANDTSRRNATRRQRLRQKKTRQQYSNSKSNDNSNSNINSNIYWTRKKGQHLCQRCQRPRSESDKSPPGGSFNAAPKKQFRRQRQCLNHRQPPLSSSAYHFTYILPAQLPRVQDFLRWFGRIVG